jgi:hypothetical protein
VDWILSFILGDPQGAEIARRIDTTIAKSFAASNGSTDSRAVARKPCSRSAGQLVDISDLELVSPLAIFALTLRSLW